VSDAAATLDLGLAELGLNATGAQRLALLELARLVDRWGARINLTGHRGLDAIVRRLILDSTALVAVLPELESLADVGSGAGFPGLPAAILRPDCRVTQIESRAKKNHFQRAACRELGLANATPVRGRAEEVDASPHAAAIAQAIGRPEAALSLMLHWVEIGGYLLLPAGARESVIVDSRVRTETVVRYRAPLGGPVRSLWIGRRIS
jgi:16S rRNA (guanine527-N7)-methyltransferase